MFEPRTQNEILKALLARLVARSELSDVAPGSVISTILGTVADEFEAVEHTLYRYRQSFSFVGPHASGEMLDARIADLPPPGMARKEASAAVGAVLSITRDGDFTDPVTVPAGSTYGSTDGEVIYVQTNDVTIAAGVSTYPQPGEQPIQILATTTGKNTNAEIGTINKIINSGPDIISCTNTLAIGGGSDRESDLDLKVRAHKWLSGLARAQPAALEWLATSLMTESGVTFKYARIHEPKELPGFSYLVVDDGSATKGYEKAASTVDGVIPESGQHIIHHHWPATKAISDEFQLYIDNKWTPAASSKFVSLYERGIILVDSAYLTPGLKWRVVGAQDSDDENFGYNVYTGPVRELQKTIEGNPSDPLGAPGFRASGTRVVVTPPELEYLKLDLTITPTQGANLSSIISTLKKHIAEWSNTLSPGQPIYESALVRVVMARPGIKNCHVLELGNMKQASGLPLDYYPTSPLKCVRILSADISIS